MVIEEVLTENEAQTIQFGEQFATRLHKGDVVVLEGELGAGKTEFVKGVCRFLAVDDLVTSPTFTIINQYTGELPNGDAVKVFHVDLYRIDDPAELAKIGFDDMIFAHDAIKLVEWPERAGSLLPSTYWKVHLEPDEKLNDVRRIVVERVGGTEA